MRFSTRLYQDGDYKYRLRFALFPIIIQETRESGNWYRRWLWLGFYWNAYMLHFNRYYGKFQWILKQRRAVSWRGCEEWNDV